MLSGGDSPTTVASALLRGRTIRTVASYILTHPGCSIQEITRGVGESQRAVYYHVKQLTSAKLVRSPSAAGHYRLEGTDLLVQTLAILDSQESSKY